MSETSLAWELWGNLPRVRPYIRPYKGLGVLSVSLTILASGAALLQPWPLAIMLNTVSGKSTIFTRLGIDNKTTVVVIAVIAGFLLTVATHALTVWNSYIDTKLEQKMVLDLRSDLFEHCQRLSLTFHDESRAGELMSRINMQASAVGSIVMAFPPLAQSLLTLAGMATIALLIDWQITLISLSAVPFIYYALAMYGTHIVPRLQRVQGLEWQSLSIVNEAMGMLRVIVSFGRERYEFRRFREQAQEAVDERVKLTVRQTAFTLGVQTATALGTSLVLGFGFIAVLNGELAIGSLIVLLSYVSSIYAPLEAISGTVGSLHQDLVQFDSSVKLLDQQPEVVEDPAALDIGRASGRVAFENVTFAYSSRAFTLRDISFTAEPGQRIAIVGPTGAGKTTLASLLIRFYDPAGGHILIDGIDNHMIKLHSYRSQFAVVLQEPLLFSGSVADNIRYGRLEATTDEVVEAAKAAGAHEFIERLPNGYDTQIGERGAGLSGGERQRICVARAFIKDAPILILDEPTSSIDSKTEQMILDALEDLMVGRTTFMIAHRLSTIRHADKIIVLNHGEIVEQGTHDELIKHDGLYKQLYRIQHTRRRRPGRTATEEDTSAEPTELSGKDPGEDE